MATVTIPAGIFEHDNDGRRRSAARTTAFTVRDLLAGGGPVGGWDPA